MERVEIKKDIFWVGAIDWNIRNFHGYTYNTKRGTTYNAYLILDKNITLIDTVYGPFADEMIEKIREIVPLEKINYIIANHVEIDHSGALPELLKLCPKAKVFGTAKCKEGLLRNFYCDMDFNIVKTLDKLNLGKRTLMFIEAPMIHWPDSMFTYCEEEKILFPNDAFGQHYAASKRFDDEVEFLELFDEAKKYYANILWPLSGVISKKIDDIKKLKLKIDMIAPSHGIIWRKNPFSIFESYISWSGNYTNKKVVIVYETMWGATEKLAKSLSQGIIDEGLEVKVYDLNQSDRTEIIKEMLDAKGFMIGSSTHDNDMLPNMAGFLEFLKGLKPKNRFAFVFGSYGWGGGATKEIEDIIKEMKSELPFSSFSIQYAPSKEDLKNCYEIARKFAKILKGGQ